MASLAAIETSYYKAIEAAKLSDTDLGDDIECSYSKHTFHDWVKRLDIYDLENDKADFYVDETIVTEFTDYRNRVVSELPKYAEYEGMKLNGQLKNIGSCQDGSKVGKMNEADSLYVLDANSITIDNLGETGTYRVFREQNGLNYEIKPRSIRKKFADGYSGVISKLPLPGCLKHGGYNSPAYSGLRYNGPAATSQFLTEDNSLLTWDMTPAFCLGREDSRYQEVRKIIQPALEINRKTMFGDMGIHLIPDSNEDIWRLSTAQLEADLLRELIPLVAPMRKVLSSSKVLASRLRKWNSQNLIPPDCLENDLGITKRIDAYLESRERELGERLNDELRYVHIWIPPAKRRQYHEDEKTHISINTAAIKHILLAAALKKPEAFAGKEDKELVRQLMILVFNTLGDPSEFTSPHAFLKGVKIPHFSVLSSQAPNKMTLALSIKEQCRMLVLEAMEKPGPLAITKIDDFLQETNKRAVPSCELPCSEYCFNHWVNPFQHPCLDRNIHHLTALLTALSNTCGGVVQLYPRDRTLLGEREFSLFKSRLYSLSGVRENLLEMSQTRDTTSWAIIAARKCQELLFCNFSNNDMKLCIDINGQVLLEKWSQNDGGEEVSRNPKDESLYPVSKGITDASVPLKIRKLSTIEDKGRDDVGETGQPPVEFSTELNWDKNKKNWQKSLREAKQSTDECIASCDIWEPRLPMQMTPDRDSLKCLFPSDAECRETICQLETKTPGFAIANRSWASFLPQLDFLQRPPCHLCDILTVAKCEVLQQPSACLWVVVSSSTEQVIPRQVEYMFIVGRTIKYQLSKQNTKVPNLAIRCVLHSTHTEDNHRIENTFQTLGIQNMQGFLSSAFSDKDTFDGIRECIAVLLLSQESPIKTCAGNQLSVKLSAQQIQILLAVKSKKVSYVSSAPGTGKTLCGLALYRDFGKERSVYISPTEPLFQYLKYNGCEATLVRNDEELLQQMECGAFENKVCVIIDESHRMRCSKASLRELFVLMKKHRMRLFVFADNVYQSFDRENQQQIQTCIYELTREVFGRPPYEPILTEIYRNTRKVVSFLQHAMEDPDSDNEEVLDITSGNTHVGDGIQCIALENLTGSLSDNGLVQYLRPLLDTRYHVTDVAVLLDSGYTDDDICSMHQILRSHLPRVTTQSSATFPREGIIVDRIERFAGLDAALCIFLLSVGGTRNRDATIENPRYRVYLASRATHKAVFVVPKITGDVVRHMKFDHFQPPVEFQKLLATEEHETLRGYALYGFCYDDSKLYCVEWLEVEATSWLTVYDISGASDRSLILRDRVEVEGVDAFCRPRVDSSHRVYVPCRYSGVRIFQCERGRLLPARDPLKCVERAESLAVNTVDSLYVGGNNSICLVSVSTDTVIRRLHKPEQVGDVAPWNVSVLGETVLVCYGDNTLVMYRSDSATLGQVLQTPKGLVDVSSINTDGHSSFLVTDYDYNSVFVLDRAGNLRHRIQGDPDRGTLRDCAVVRSQLWLGYYLSGIVVMSSE